MEETETECDPPTVTRAVTDNPKGGDAPPLAWQIKGDHPYVAGMKVLAMYLHSGILEIYSTDGKSGLRDRFPANRVRTTQEYIHADILNDELDASEAKHLDSPYDEDAPDPLPPITTNGPTAPS